MSEFRGEVKTLVQTYVELLYPDDLEMQDALFENITSGKEAVTLEEMRNYVSARSSWYAEIEAVNPAMAVVHNSNDEFVGTVEVMDDSDDPEIVEVFVNDDQMNEVSSTNLYEDGQFWEDYDAETFGADANAIEDPNNSYRYGIEYLDKKGKVDGREFFKTKTERDIWLKVAKQDIYDDGDTKKYGFTNGATTWVEANDEEEAWERFSGQDPEESWGISEVMGAETFNADSDHFRKVGWVIPKEAYPHHMRVADNNWAKDFYCDEAWVERHGDEYTLNWVVRAYKPTKVQRPAESVFSKTYPYTERGWFNGYMRWAQIPMRGKNWSEEVQEKLGSFVGKRQERDRMTSKAESFNAMSFKQWSQDEMNEELHGGQDMNFDSWLNDEIHTHGNIPLRDWGYEEEHDEPEHQHAESMMSKRGKVRTLSGKPHKARELKKDRDISPEEAKTRLSFRARKGIDTYAEPFEEIENFYSGKKGILKIVGLGALVSVGVWITKNKLLE